MLVYFKKSLNLFFWILDKIHKNSFIKYYPKYLKWLGIKIDDRNFAGTWISPTTFFDSSRYDLIYLGKYITISFDVAILVHDFSIVHAARKWGGRFLQLPIMLLK